MSDKHLEEPLWQHMDGASAWLHIDRLAESRAQIRQMMTAWLDANRSPAPNADADAQLTFVLAHGLPMARAGKYRYHGVSQVVWHSTAREAVLAAMADPAFT